LVTALERIRICAGTGYWDSAKEKDLPFAIWALADFLERCATLTDRPCLFRGKNAPIFVFLD
jgi:hypothetical protein